MVVQAGDPVLIITDDAASMQAGLYVQTLQDPGKKLPFEAVISKGYSYRFTDSQSPSLDIQDEHTAYWFKLTVHNQSAWGSQFVLEAGTPVIDLIDCYQQDERGQWVRSTAGDMRSAIEKTVPDRLGIFACWLPPGEVRVLYLRMEAQTRTSTRLLLSEQSHYYQQRIREELFYGLFFGFLLLMACLMAVYFLIYRQKVQLVYLAYLLFTMTFQSMLSGHFHLYVQTPIGGWQNLALATVMGISLGLACWFGIVFLEVKKHVPLVWRMLWGMLLVAAGLTIGGLVLPYRWIMSFYQFTAAMPILLLVVAGVWTWTKTREAHGLYYALGYVLYFAGVLAYILGATGQVVSGFWTVHGFEFGVLAEMAMLAFAIIHQAWWRKRQIRRAKRAALEEAARSREASRQMLEEQLVQQTAQRAAITEEIHRLQADRLLIEDALSRQKHELGQQKHQLDLQAYELEEGLRQASRLQQSILPTVETFKETFEDAFIFFRPKRVVSGDIYLLTEKQGRKIVAVADCTGHGIAGAFLGMLVSEQLNRIIERMGLTVPGDILYELHRSLAQAMGEAYERDKVSVTVCAFKPELPQQGNWRRTHMEVALAGHSLSYIHHGQGHLITGDPSPLGGLSGSAIRHFHTWHFELSTGSTVYLTTDGYADQLGGEQQRKFLEKRLHEFFLSSHTAPLSTQHQQLEALFDHWMNSARMHQMDDVLVIGLRLF